MLNMHSYKKNERKISEKSLRRDGLGFWLYLNPRWSQRLPDQSISFRVR